MAFASVKGNKIRLESRRGHCLQGKNRTYQVVRQVCRDGFSEAYLAAASKVYFNMDLEITYEDEEGGQVNMCREVTMGGDALTQE